MTENQYLKEVKGKKKKYTEVTVLKWRFFPTAVIYKITDDEETSHWNFPNSALKGWTIMMQYKS